MKAATKVSASCTEIRKTVNELESALNTVEKSENASKIRCAIDHLNDACGELQQYED